MHKDLQRASESGMTNGSAHGAQPGSIDHPDGMDVEARPVGVETAMTMAASASAQIMATMQMRERSARDRPRDWNVVQRRIIEECKRPGFAEVALYNLERGQNTITGLSIRFAEAAIRCMGNLMVLDTVIHEDDRRRLIRVTVLDLESNTDYGTEILLDRTVERNDPYGREVLGSRMNSKNKMVYIVRASEDEVTQKKGVAVSKAVRNAALRLLPGDIQDAAERQIFATLKADHDKSPEATAKRLVESYASAGVPETEIRRYLGGVEPAQMTSEQYKALRAVWPAIKEGAITWAAFFPPADPQAGVTGPVVSGAAASGSSSKKSKLNEKMLGTSSGQTMADATGASAKTETREKEPATTQATSGDGEGGGFLGGS